MATTRYEVVRGMTQWTLHATTEHAGTIAVGVFATRREAKAEMAAREQEQEQMHAEEEEIIEAARAEE